MVWSPLVHIYSMSTNSGLHKTECGFSAYSYLFYQKGAMHFLKQAYSFTFVFGC